LILAFFLTLKNNSNEGASSNLIANGISLFAIHFKSKEMKVVNTLSRNKASVGDIVVVDTVTCTVIEITKQYVHLTNGKQYPKKMFNSWIRLANHVKSQQKAAETIRTNAKKYLEDIKIMRKEAKAEYDAKYRQPSQSYYGQDTTLLPYIILTGVGETVKFYFSSTKKADPEDLEKSYQSLHGVGYKAFAHGFYIRENENIALIGINSFKGRNNSEKRIMFALKCLKNMAIDGKPFNVGLYKNLGQLLNFNKMSSENAKLLSSTPVSTFAKELKETSSEPEEKKHWSGLSGDIATSSIDQAIDDMLAPDDDYPF
jgi:hypothetical protein